MTPLTDSEVARLLTISEFQVARLRERLPIDPDELDADDKRSARLQDDPEAVRELLSELEEFVPEVYFLPLETESDWTWFYRGMRYGTDKSAPWNRIFTVLRSHGVRTAVVEENYVCLDYRSELATFYSQLNSPLNARSTRLHFFSSPLLNGALTLNDDVKKSYVGYVVCRTGHLPLVGRSVIRTPKYIDECAEVEERVHLLGQNLTVTGVPFMQQDERFAVCAQVAAWITHYSAYRRGVVERRLIADFVDQVGDTRPMRPRATQGLIPNQIADTLSALGLRTVVYATPLTGSYDYPAVPRRTIPAFEAMTERIAGLLAEVERDLGQGGSAFDDSDDSSLSDASDLMDDDDISAYAQALYFEAYQLVGAVRSADLLSRAVEDLQTHIFDSLTRPFLRSRWPIYCDTRDHAMVLVGRSERDDQITHFYHDDQFGPYLASSQGIAVSRDSFVEQGYANDDLSVDVPVEDRALEVVNGRASANEDRGREIHVLLVPQPSRCLLDPTSALNRATQIAEEVHEICGGRRLSYVASVLMGLDYKRSRYAEIQEAGGWDGAALELFSTVHLAEWVVVVEGLDADGRAVTEFVYDGTSGSNYPELQLMRYGFDVLAFGPFGDKKPRRGRIETEVFGQVKPSSRIGKAV